MEPGAIARNANVDLAAMGRIPLVDRRRLAAGRQFALPARQFHNGLGDDNHVRPKPHGLVQDRGKGAAVPRLRRGRPNATK